MTQSATTPPKKIRFEALKKIWSVIPEKKKSKVVRLWFMMILGMTLEMLSIGLVLPIVALLIKQDTVKDSETINNAISFLGISNRQDLLMYVLCAFVIIYLIKNSYLAFLAWRQSSLIVDLQSYLSNKLFSIYLTQPYIFHVRRNSAHLVRNVHGEVSFFVNNTISQYMLFFAEAFVAFGLFILLFFAEPLGTLTVFGTLFFAGALFQKVTKGRITAWGNRRQLHDGLRVKHLQQGLGGVKDVKLLGREKEFLSLYKEHTEHSMHMIQLQFFMQQIPKLWLELLAIFGIGLLVLIMTNQNQNVANILPKLALFAAVCFRLMPSVNRMLSALQQIRFSTSTVDLIYSETHLEPVETNNTLSNEKLKFSKTIELRNISYKYPDSKKSIFNNLDLTIKQGSSVGFVGLSGSGKSTLVDLIIGLHTPDVGFVKVDDIEIKNNLRAWQNQIGYVPQSIYLSDDTLRKNIAFGLPDNEIDDLAIQSAIVAASLDDFVNTLPDGMNANVGERGVKLSGGQRQRIGIARALYHDPQVLVLDEATSALDVKTELEVMAAINKMHGKKTILIVAHRLSTVENCDSIYNMSSGLLVEHKLNKEHNMSGKLC